MKKSAVALTAASLLAATLTIGVAAPAEAAVPWEYKNALLTAQSYIDHMDFSNKKLYTQLTSPYGEQFPAKAAKYALEHVRVNYKKEALGSAKSYVKNLHMSKAQVYDQLTSAYGEQFTVSQADYAIQHLG